MPPLPKLPSLKPHCYLLTFPLLDCPNSPFAYRVCAPTRVGALRPWREQSAHAGRSRAAALRSSSAKRVRSIVGGVREILNHSFCTKNKGRIPKDPPFANKKDYRTDLAFPTSAKRNQSGHSQRQERSRGWFGDDSYT